MTAADDRQIADAIRALGKAHHAAQVDETTRSAAFAHLDAARELLADGEPRLRWYEADPTDRQATRRRNRELSAFTGTVNAVAPPMAVTPEEGPGGRPELVGRVRIDRTREGPPHSVHGGVVAGMFDELLGAAQRLGGSLGGVTARLTVRYRRPTPIEEDLELRAWVAEERNRRIVVKGECRVAEGDGRADGPVTAEAEAIFLKVDFEGMESAMRDREAGAASRPAPPAAEGG
jgi:acyl-coenzyme A thioesterase PaaI-like protein